MLEPKGVTQKQLFENTSLQNLDVFDSDATVNAETFLTVMINAVSASNDPYLGLRLGKEMELGGHGQLSDVLIYCKDLEHLLITLTKYISVVTDIFEIAFSVSTKATISIKLRDDVESLLESFPDYSFVRHLYVDFIFSSFSSALTSLYPGQDLGLNIGYNFAKPKEPQIYQEILGGEILFGCENCTYSISPALFAKPLPFYNVATFSLKEKKLHRILNERKSEDSFYSQVLAYMLVHQDERSREVVSEGMGLSSRTFSRRLEKEGTHFQKVLQESQKLIALRYIEESDLAIQEIAYEMGYGDPSNFRRAFISWVGTSPARYRKLLRAHEH